MALIGCRFQPTLTKEALSADVNQNETKRTQPDPVNDEEYLVKFYMDELSEVIEAADSVLLVRRFFVIHGLLRF